MLLRNLKTMITGNKVLHKFFSMFFYLDWNLRKAFKYKFIDRNVLINHKAGYSYQEYGTGDRVLVKPPLHCEPSIPKEMKKFFNKTVYFPPSFYNVIEDTFLIGPNAVGIDASNNIISDTDSRSISVLDKCSPKLFMYPRKIKTDIHLDCAAVFLSPWINAFRQNYYHWITECLFSLEAIDSYSNVHGISPKILINSNPTRYQIDSLKLLGYTDRDYIQWNFDKAGVQKLIRPSRRQLHVEGIDVSYPSAINWFREKLSTNMTNGNYDFSQNILVSRQHSYGRKILNYDKVMSLLERYDFVSYTLEELRFEDQVNLFSRAKNVIGAHGAGMINMIFCNHANIIELFGAPPKHYHMYYLIANILRLRYVCMFVKHSFDNYNETNKAHSWKEHDLIIDTVKLDKVLQKCLND